MRIDNLSSINVSSNTIIKILLRAPQTTISLVCANKPPVGICLCAYPCLSYFSWAYALFC
jgi:hypothetical protein